VSYYVYELIDPRDKSVFYVGKGTGKRIDHHELEARRGRVSRKCDRIREIESAGLLVAKRKVKQFSDEVEAYLFEADHIEALGLHNLTNVLPGGGSPRAGSSTYADRVRVRVAAELIARCGAGKVKAVEFLGQRLELEPIIRGMKNAVFKIAERRGIDWVNGIAKKYHLEFSNVPAV
jgi:hypothetical protein